MEKAKLVLSFTRRTDGVGNREMLESFLNGLRKGEITYAHPRFALNPGPPERKKMCTFSVSPQTIAAISWWSKDWSNLIEMWPAHADVLDRYHHHFSFALHDGSITEPGVLTSPEDRIRKQLAWLVAKSRELGQDPDASIMVKLDPITVYSYQGNTLDNLDHVPLLCSAMKSMGLTRIHISFVQFDYPKTRTRLRRYKESGKIDIPELSMEEQRFILDTRVLPFTVAAGIHLETCTGLEDIKHGACVGWRDIASITGLKNPGPVFQKDARKNCLCYPHRDVGDKSAPCTHGCLYCMSNPKIDW